ncbi:MAG: helix-turn-helix domain-containing protein [Pseudomonadota bacterium]
MEANDAPEFDLDALCALTDLPKRTVRYYMQIGLVDRPQGETRAARYSARHLDQLLQIRRWSQAGLSLERIRDLLGGAPAPLPAPPRRAGTIEVRSHVLVADGIELVIDPALARLSPEQLRQFFADVLSAYDKLHNEESPS